MKGLGPPPENTLVKLLEHFPNKKWNYEHLSLNQNITFEMVLAHPELPWCYSGLSRNKFNYPKRLKDYEAGTVPHKHTKCL